MRKILFLIVAITLLVYGCGEETKEVLLSDDHIDEIPENKPVTEIEALLNSILVSVKDKDGLRVSGYGYAYGRNINNIETFAIGIKNKKLWCGIFSGNENIGFSEEYTWISKDDFIDSIKIIDIGYGQKDTLMLSLNSDSPVSVHCYFVSKDTFAIQSCMPTIFINNDKMHCEDINLQGYWTNRYFKTSQYGVDGCFVSGLDGKIIYKIKRSFLNPIPVSLYEYIEIEIAESNYHVVKYNAQHDKEIWNVEISNLGQVIDGNKPKITHKHTIADQSMVIDFDITNYDGSSTTKTVKIDLNSGEIIK